MNEDTAKEKISWRKRMIRILIGISAGAILGYAYYYFIGCNTGSCPITSNPMSSIFYGMLIGGIWTYK
jgi:ABC-type Fe3+-siderophore transport system permease subunit